MNFGNFKSFYLVIVFIINGNLTGNSSRTNFSRIGELQVAGG